MTGATSPYITAAEAAAYWRFPSPAAFLLFAKRHHIPHVKCGRIVRFDRDVVAATFTRSSDGQPVRIPRSGARDIAVFGRAS